MTPYSRRMAAAALTALTISATGYATHPDDARADIVDRLAPGGNITSVVRATERLGWPHAPQPAEMRDVARMALHFGVTRRQSGSVRCSFGATIGSGRCDVRATTRTGRPRVILTTQLWDLYEDGSYRVRMTAPRSPR